MVHKPTNNRNGIGCRRLPCSGLRLAVLYRTDHSHGRKVLDSAQIVQLHPATTADYSKLVNQLLCHSYHTQTEDQTKDQTKEQPLAVIATHPTPFLLSLSLHSTAQRCPTIHHLPNHPPHHHHHRRPHHRTPSPHSASEQKKSPPHNPHPNRCSHSRTHE